MVHPAMLFLGGEAARVLCIGGGACGIVREVLRYRWVRRVVQLDIETSAIELARRYQADAAPAHWDDPRYELLIDDPMDYLATTTVPFDLVVNDVSTPGPAAAELFTEEACHFIRSRLQRRRGLYVTWAGALGRGPIDPALRVIHLVGSVFPHAYPYLTQPPGDSTWLTLVAALQPLDPLAAGPGEIDAHLAERVEGDLADYDGPTHHHMFQLPKNVRRMLTTGAS